jgi:hypothetical protein
MTSHSPRVIESFADENLIFVFRQDKGIKIVDGSPTPALLETIGIEYAIDTALLVEDEAAEQFTRFLLEQFRPDLSRRSEIVNKQGEGNISALLSRAGKITSFRFIGVFDGDQRDKIPEDISPLSIALPGSLPIEKSFKALVERNVPALEEITGKSSVSQVLFSLQGRDHHDWYEGLAEQLGLSKQQLYPVLFRLWSKDGQNHAEGRGWVEAVSSLFRST